MTHPPQGIRVVIDGIDELAFVRLLADATADPAFARPLQLQVSEPRAGQPGVITLAFEAGHRQAAIHAVQRLKTLMLRHGAQVDDVVVPGSD